MKRILHIGEGYVLSKHKLKHAYIQYISLLAVATIMCLEAHAQRPESSGPVSLGIKSFTEIVASDAKSQYGMLGVHEVGGKIYLEIPDSLLGRDILTINRIAKGWAGDKPFDPFLNFIGFSGDLANESLFRFDRGSGDAIVIYPLDYSNRVQADDGKLVLPANADVLPIFHSFPVLCRNGSDDGSLVDATEFLSGDNTIMTFSGSLRRKFKVGAMQPQHSSISGVEVTESNLITTSIKTYSYNSETVRLGMRAVWFLLPATPYEIRQPDHRVGYYTQSAIDYSNAYTPQQSLRMVKRWRMEPRPEDREAYFRGEPVEPAKPLVIYIDPAMPEAWVPYMIQGINDWQPAFEQAGFKNAIHGERVPPGMESRMVGDARYPMICYKPSRVRNATTELVTDPRSGEILNAHIAWHHGHIQNIIQWRYVMAPLHQRSLQNNETDTAFIGAMIRKTIAHEVGHVLGLLHNFGASSTVPVERLREPQWLAENPVSPSIMDYVRVNYVAQPEDNVPLSGIVPRLGPYDYWAIEWGYGLQGHEEWITEKLTDPNLWYGHQSRVDDPRCQAEDLGDDPVAAAGYGIRNLKRNARIFLSGTPGDQEPAPDITEALLSQYSYYVRHAVVAFNGPHEKKAAALAFLAVEFFKCPDWLVSCGERTAEVDVPTQLGKLQREQLPILLTYLAAKRDTQLLQNMLEMIFTEADTTDGNAWYILRLQQAYVAVLNQLEATMPYENYLIIKMIKDVLADRLDALQPGHVDPLTRLHLENLKLNLKP
ncbi:zinc-dependent metalloprotease [Parapedobacter sp. GCM10030251]|uniref:zinc-dependent metalloprotease n=1 Tax=Parapedobacter sp. GCM10030251 TaxID=3273419 RepID=UPI0036140085